MNTRIIAKAVIFLPNGEALALRRSRTDVRRPLQWDLPGGYCDQGEEPDQAVVREIQEEAGLNVSSVKLRFATTEVRKWVNNDGEKTENVVFLFYVGQTNNKSVKLSHEHSEFKWMGLATAIEEFEYPLHKRVLKHLLDNKLV